MAMIRLTKSQQILLSELASKAQISIPAQLSLERVQNLDLDMEFLAEIGKEAEMQRSRSGCKAYLRRLTSLGKALKLPGNDGENQGSRVVRGPN
jgi:hypothetical protein